MTVGKDDVLLWFKESCSSGRVSSLCRMLRCCTALELRYIYTVLEDVLRDCYQTLKNAESLANKFAKPLVSEDLDASCHPCVEFTLSSEEDRANCLATVALLKGSNHSLASQVLFPTLSTIKLQNVPEDSRVREEVLLMLYMAANHPAFSFAERRVLWEKIDMLEAAKTSAEAEDERGLVKKTRSQGASAETYSTLDDNWEDTGSTNWADCDDVYPDHIVVTGCQKSKGTGRFDSYRFEYTFEVTWSDGGFNRCYKTYNDLFQFQNKLLNENPGAAGKTATPRIVPFLPGKKLLSKSTRELAEKRLPEIADYATKLTELPHEILSSQLVVDFFSTLGLTIDFEDGGTQQDAMSSPVTSPAGELQSPSPAGELQSPSPGAQSLGDSRNSTPHASQDDVSVTPSDGSKSQQSNPPNGTGTVSAGSTATSRAYSPSMAKLASLTEGMAADGMAPLPLLSLFPSGGDDGKKGPICVPRIGGGVVYYLPHEVNADSPMTYLARHGKCPSKRQRMKMAFNASDLLPRSPSPGRTPSSAPGGMYPISTVGLASNGGHVPKTNSRPVVGSTGSTESALIRAASSSLDHDPPSPSWANDKGRESGSGHAFTEPTQRRGQPSASGGSDFGRRDSVSSNTSRSGAGDIKVFANLLEWLKALRLHKYATLLEPYSFDVLMAMSQEELDSLDMTVGARSKLTQHLDWMRKHGCEQFTIMCKSDHNTGNGRKSRSQSRTNSSTSAEYLDPGVLELGPGARQGVTTGLRRRKKSDQPSVESISPTVSTWSLPIALSNSENEFASARPLGGDAYPRPSFSAQPGLPVDYSTHRASLPVLTGKRGEPPASLPSPVLRERPSHLKQSGSIKPQQLLNGTSNSSRPKPKASSSMSNPATTHRSGTSGLSWRSTGSADCTPPVSRRHQGSASASDTYH